MYAAAVSGALVRDPRLDARPSATFMRSGSRSTLFMLAVAKSLSSGHVYGARGVGASGSIQATSTRSDFCRDERRWLHHHASLNTVAEGHRAS